MGDRIQPELVIGKTLTFSSTSVASTSLRTVIRWLRTLPTLYQGTDSRRTALYGRGAMLSRMITWCRWQTAPGSTSRPWSDRNFYTRIRKILHSRHTFSMEFPLYGIVQTRRIHARLVVTVAHVKCTREQTGHTL